MRRGWVMGGAIGGAVLALWLVSRRAAKLSVDDAATRSSDATPSPTLSARAPAPPVVRSEAPVGDARPPPGPEGRDVVLRIFVDGRPSIPEEYSITTGRGAFFYMKRIRSGPVEEDRARAELRFRMRPPPDPLETDVWFHAADGWPVETTARASSATDAFVADVHSQTAGFLVPRVTPPGVHEIDVAMFSPETDRWDAAPAPPGYHFLGLVERSGTVMYGPLRAGRYRLFDETSGLMSDIVDVVSGGPLQEVTLDLSKAGLAEGRVSIPATKADLADWSEVRIHAEGEGILHLRPGTVGPDGRFAVGVPGDRPVTIRPWHPVLVPADAGGSAVVVQPRADLVLRLVAANWCSFRPAPFPQPKSWLPPLRVLRYAGEPVGAPVAEHPVILRDGRLGFGGYPAGTWTLWLDVHGFAPAVLRAVDLPEGPVDLGEVRLERGSGVRVRVLWNEPAEPPLVIVDAEHLDPPQYRRLAEAKPDPFVVLTGLGPGRFRVRALDKGAVREKEMELRLDGTTDADLSLDLR